MGTCIPEPGDNGDAVWCKVFNPEYKTATTSAPILTSNTPYYLNGASIASHLTIGQPTDPEIVRAIERAGDSFDKYLTNGNFDWEKYEIVWYSIKTSGESNSFNVDGYIREKGQYTLSYVANGGYVDRVPDNEQHYQGVEVTVKVGSALVGDERPSRPGYTFLGWSEDQTATEPDYADTDGNRTFTMPAKDVVLYAVWTANANTRYTIEDS